MTYFSSTYLTRPDLIELLIRRQMNCETQAFLFFHIILLIFTPHILWAIPDITGFYATTAWTLQIACKFEIKIRTFPGCLMHGNHICAKERPPALWKIRQLQDFPRLTLNYVLLLHFSLLPSREIIVLLKYFDKCLVF